MWNRGELKESAKRTLRKYYWPALLVTFLAAVLCGCVPSLGNRFGPVNNFNNSYSANQGYNFFSGGFRGIPLDHNLLPIMAGALAAMAFVLTMVSLIALAIGVAYRIFVAGPLQVGMRRYFLEARQERSDAANLLYSFRQGMYLNAVKAMAWRLLFTFLWTLLFIVPGIVKGYAYSMIPYIMADNPGMGYARAMKLSMAMTKGHKWSIFVLDLSFLGWAILGLLCCCLGLFFLSPYFYATKAEMYVALRRNAIEAGIGTANEFGQAVSTEAVTA